jgi:PPP family 3-phenylpropionic acid transporter
VDFTDICRLLSFDETRSVAYIKHRMPSGVLTAGYLRLLYFVFFIAIGSCSPFASIFLKRVLVNGHGIPAIGLIGIIYAILPFVGMIASMSASFVADRFRLGMKIMALCCIISVCSAVILGQTAGPWALSWSLDKKFLVVLTLSLVYGFGTGPISSLMDAETLHFLNARNAREKYGTFRLWGTNGWFVSTIFMGALLTWHNDIGLIYYGAAAGCLLLGIAAAFGRNSGFVARGTHMPLGHLKSNSPFHIFLAFIFLNGLIYNATYTYTGYFFDEIMSSFWQIGLIFGTWSIFEIPIMLHSHGIIKRFGNRRLIVAGLAINALRLFLFGTFTVHTPYGWKFLIALLQGPAFALTHIGIIDYIDRRAHHDMRATYLSVASVTQNTLGASAGGIIGSIIIRQLGTASLLRLSGIAMIGLAIFFVASVKADPARTRTEPMP